MLFEPGTFPNGPQLKTQKALLLLDFQHDFVDPTGNLYVENIKPFIERLPDLIESFRQHGDVVWTCTEYRGPRPSIAPDLGCFNIMVKQCVKMLDAQLEGSHVEHESDDQAEDENPALEPDAEAVLAEQLPKEFRRCCLPGTTGASIVPTLATTIDRGKDIVLYKNDYSAFADMSLVFQLRTRMVTKLYICGALSNITVYATVLDAVRHGFDVTVVEDCLGYRDESCHISAMRQMADNMGAEGIDYQELMDDLAGLLGEVIHEDAFITKFRVDLGRPSRPERQDLEPHSQRAGVEPSRSSINAHTPPPPVLSYTHDSPERKPSRHRSSTIDSSPPRKRSTDDLEDELEDYQLAKLSPLSSYRRQSYESYGRPGSRENKPKVRVRRKDAADGSRRSKPSSSQQLSSADTVAEISTNPTVGREPGARERPESSRYLNVSRKMARKASQATLGPTDRIGDGTSSVIYNILSDAYAEEAFNTLKRQVCWQKMYHRSGEVPRLVAVQGAMNIATTDGSKSYPIYRHPADESPQLLPFDGTVDVLRRECEKHVGHPLNHVLIQHYRNSEDNISEHSDKTLDIVRNSSIVNLSLGAQRTMTLRTKKVDSDDSKVAINATAELPENPATARSSPRASSTGFGRTVQRIPLPHASLFILSTTTNARYLHSIRADKRPAVEKSEAELAFNRERISLTFRYIGTFVTEDEDGQQTIWGQGATGKTQEMAKPVLQPSIIAAGDTSNGNDNASAKPATDEVDESAGDISIGRKGEADRQAEAMIIGFGRENHENELFDWDGVYGSGFDVLNFVTKPIHDSSELVTSAVCSPLRSATKPADNLTTNFPINT